MRRGWVWLVFAMAVVALAGCGETQSWKQKTILEVETPSGLVSGGSVVEVKVSRFGAVDRALSSNASSYSSRGEASFVEVAPGKYLFALSVYEPFVRTLKTFTEAADKNDSKVTTARLETLRESRILAPENYPTLVTFADVNDPKSVQLVDPANLAATFGPGFALKQITLGITDEKVTEGAIEKILGWLDDDAVMKNPEWKQLPLESRNTINGLFQPN